MDNPIETSVLKLRDMFIHNLLIFETITKCVEFRFRACIHNSVCTRRHRHINSFTSASLNTTKIALMKVSHVGVGMVGPELLFLIYINVVFCAELTLPQHGFLKSPAGSEVMPPSVFHGHNCIEVLRPDRSRRVGIRLLQPDEAG